MLIGSPRSIGKVDQTMADIQEQTQLANEVSEAISTNIYNGVDIDEVSRAFLVGSTCVF